MAILVALPVKPRARMDEHTDVTRLLLDLRDGRTDALDSLLPVLYDELHRLAHLHMRGERTGHTLNTTALVHEAYLRLVDIRQVAWEDRTHFLATASRAMRRVLVDHARGRLREKRGQGAVPLPIEAAAGVAAASPVELVALDDALRRLSEYGERLSDVVDCRVFGGLTLAETAAALGVSTATIKRDWAFCRAWLNRELGDDGEVER